MSWNIFPEPVLQLLEKSLSWRSRQQEIIAGNIANLDTPRYTRKELDFQKVLTQHLQGGSGVSLASTHPGHLPGSRSDPYAAVTDTRSGVDLDREMVQLAENQLAYNASVQMLIKKIDQVRTVLDGERR